jgi:hypothetical protein
MKIKIKLFLFLATFILLASCSNKVMTVEAPFSEELEEELTHLLDNLFWDNHDCRVDYKEGSYIVKSGISLSDKEKEILQISLAEIIACEGANEFPLALRIIVTETSERTLEAIGLKRGDSIDVPLEGAYMDFAVFDWGETLKYYLGAFVTYEGELPNLTYYQTMSGVDPSLVEGTVMGDYFNAMANFPLTADYRIEIISGSETIPTELTFEPLEGGLLVDGVIVHSINATWPSPAAETLLNAGYDFLTETGLSQNLLGYVMFPHLAKEAISFQVEGRES